MRILITNDDGINAPGLKVLERIAKELASKKGEVWTVAPAFEQSGVAHCISYTHPMMVSQMDERRFAVEGSPADCVLVCLHDVMKDARPDLILSGVNCGNNSAENTLYSGTIGAAIEGALQGVTSIALSQYFGPDNAQTEDPFEASDAHGAEVVRRILAQVPDTQDAYPLLFNVNFPPVPAADVKGVQVARQGRRPNVLFGVEPHISPSGKRFMWIKDGNQRMRPAEGTDAAVNLDGYISVTPMRADLTADDVLEQFSANL